MTLLIFTYIYLYLLIFTFLSIDACPKIFYLSINFHFFDLIFYFVHFLYIITKRVEKNDQNLEKNGQFYRKKRTKEQKILDKYQERTKYLIFDFYLILWYNNRQICLEEGEAFRGGFNRLQYFTKNHATVRAIQFQLRDRHKPIPFSSYLE